MKVKNRIIRETVIRLTESDMDQLASEYGNISDDLRNPMIRHLIGNLVGDVREATTPDYR